MLGAYLIVDIRISVVIEYHGVLYTYVILLKQMKKKLSNMLLFNKHDIMFRIIYSNMQERWMSITGMVNRHATHVDKEIND